jgi:hypothetical protein
MDEFGGSQCEPFLCLTLIKSQTLESGVLFPRLAYPEVDSDDRTHRQREGTRKAG